jgi:hypothetical protein
MHQTGPGTRRRAFLLVASSLALAIAGWLMLRTYTTAASRECVALYHAARTAADSAAVDRIVPHPDRPEATSCGFTRSSARWQ